MSVHISLQNGHYDHNDIQHAGKSEKNDTRACRINIDTMNENLKLASYAVRGPIVTRSLELGRKLADSNVNLPFGNIISCNIGNPQSLGQRPLSFIRDVLSLVINPSLKSRAQFPADVIARADKYLSGIASVGAYSESQGVLAVREEVAEFITARDVHAASPEDIFLTNGASEGVRFCMQTILRDPTSGYKDGVLTPIPQYPLYSALTTLMNGILVPYYLEESLGWTMNVASLKTIVDNARSDNVHIRAMVVINPGNPTGNILPLNILQDIILFCKNENICLMADEVYQDNIWKIGAKFISCRKVAYDMNAFEGPFPLQLISFHSISKGFLGECGLRGGYFEMLGIPGEVKAELYKLASISLCSNVIGQIGIGVMVRPPVAGEESYELYATEKRDILASLCRRAERMSDALDAIAGISCTKIEGALYAFPSISLSDKAISAAQSNGVQPDAWYCMELLEQTGIVLVPGSGFGQVEGSFHFRTTILPAEEKVDDVVALLKDFHLNFTSRYE